MTATGLALCEPCSGRGQLAPGTACPVCGGSGVSTPADAAAWREQGIRAAVAAYEARLRQQGTADAAAELRTEAQAGHDAREAARTATLAAQVAAAHAMTLGRAQDVLDAATATADRLVAAAQEAAVPPDPTDPPPGAPIPPGFGSGDVFYVDSLLARQIDVWGGLNVSGSGGFLTNPMTTLGDLITGGVAGAAGRLGVGSSGQVLTVVGGVPAWAAPVTGFTNPMTAAADLIDGGAGGAPQRLAAGGLGQVLSVQAGPVLQWVNSPSGFANPMTLMGDLITAGFGGAAFRLAVGSANQVLTVVGGVPAWANASSGFANPMTVLGDLITGSTGGAAVRLAVGSANQVLTVVGGVPAWQAPASGFSNPMTAAGDLITGSSGGSAVRLGVGATNQVLTVIGGVPVWANAASGFANPMSAAGDLITGGSGGTAARLGVGTPGQVLTVPVSGTALLWASPGSIVVPPSADTSGATDTAAIAAAITALSSPGTNATTPGGLIRLLPGSYYVTGAPAINLPAQTTAGGQGGYPVSLRGAGSATVINLVGNGTAVFCHRNSGYGGQFGQPADKTVSFIKDLIIDGTLATAGAVGLDVGDGWGFDVDVKVVNFSASGCIGANIINRHFWTEKGKFVLHLMNNDTAMAIDTTGGPGTISHEYCEYVVYMFCNGTNAPNPDTQNGIVIRGGSNCAGSSFWLRGNMGGNTSPVTAQAALTITGTENTNTNYSRIFASFIDMKVEGNGSNFPLGILMGSASNSIEQCFGRIGHSLQNSNLNGAEFTFRGMLAGDATLNLGWPTTAFPGVGVPWSNLGPDAIVCIVGTGPVVVNGSHGTGLTSGAFFVPAGGEIEVDTTAPTVWNVIPAGASIN